MKHPVNSRTRLKGSVSRLCTRVFRPGDPRGWAQYHIVKDTGGTLWVHCHGLDRWRQADLEIVGVPPDLREQAVDLLCALVRHAVQLRRLSADENFSARLAAPDSSFQHCCTLRESNHGDRGHRGMLRIVDRNAPQGSGFPSRLFAAHLAALAEDAAQPRHREALCRRSLELFPGDYVSQHIGVQESVAGRDMTELQQAANLAARIGLAHALFDQNRRDEGLDSLREAIARCPGWAREYKAFVVADGGGDFYSAFWADADINAICVARRPANGLGPCRPAALGGQTQGFGKRAVGFGSRSA